MNMEINGDLTLESSYDVGDRFRIHWKYSNIG
jgi:hypothetical protein